MYKGMTGIVLCCKKDIPCRVKNTPIVSFNPFSSLSSFQGTNCACRPVDGHPWGGATDFHTMQIAKKVKTLRFSRRAWPSLFVPLRVEQLDDTQDCCTVKKSPSTSLNPRHTDVPVNRCDDDIDAFIIHVDEAHMSSPSSSGSAHGIETHGDHRGLHRRLRAKHRRNRISLANRQRKPGVPTQRSLRADCPRWRIGLSTLSEVVPVLIGYKDHRVEAVFTHSIGLHVTEVLYQCHPSKPKPNPRDIPVQRYYCYRYQDHDDCHRNHKLQQREPFSAHRYPLYKTISL